MLCKCRLNESELAHPAQRCLLAAAVIEAPDLFKALSYKDRAALAGCSQQLRQAVHSLASTLVIQHQIDVGIIVKCDWPQLKVVIVQNQHSHWQHFVPWPSDSRSHPLTQYEAQWTANQGTRCRVPDTALISHYPAVLVVAANFNLAQVNASSAAGLRQLCSAAFHHVCRISLGHNGLGTEGIRRWTCDAWPSLTTPDLSCGGLCSSAMDHLARGQWPALSVLNLSKNRLDSTAMQGLLHITWPKLAILDLHGNLQLGSAAVALILPQNRWRLRNLDLSCQQLCSPKAAASHHHQPYGEALDPDQRQLGANTLLQLSLATWDDLHCLDLRSNSLIADQIQLLVAASMPNLLHLFLSYNQLDAAAARFLSTGTWPKLLALCLGGNAFDNSAMAYIAKGRWPKLESLTLEGNPYDESGIKALSKGNWRRLASLTLAENALHPKSIELLSLHQEDIALTSNGGPCTMPRSPLVHGLKTYPFWPKLSAVTWGAADYDSDG